MSPIKLLVYADESGIHGGARYCVVSGYIGSPRQWKLFERDWRSIQKAAHAPEKFHATDFFYRSPRGRRQRDYEGWSDSKARQFIRDLTDAINQRQIQPVGGAVDVPAFEVLTKGERRFLTGGAWRNGKFITHGAPTKPYYLSAQHLLVNALNEANHDAVIHFTFDRQDEYVPRLIETFNEIIAIDRIEGHELEAARIGVVSSVDGARVAALQAADLYCYGWYCSLVERPNQVANDDLHFALEVLTRKQDGIRLADAEQLERNLAMLPPEVRQQMRDSP